LLIRIYMLFSELIFLFVAGFLGGLINSIAGGGSFITFPALLWVGIPAISANATNTMASCAGYLSGTYAFRQELSEHKQQLPLLVLISLVGGISGAWLLLQTTEQLFREVIPWLLLFATLLFIFGADLNLKIRQLTSNYRHVSLLGSLSLITGLFMVGVYGGFFNAALGIILLSYLVLAGHSDIHLMNGLKLMISSVISIIAVGLFIYEGIIAWTQGFIVLGGTLVGGYVAAHYSRQLPQHYVRYFVILVSCSITLYFFIDTYYF